MVKVYHYPKCGSCQKAIKFLKEKNIEYKEIDIISNPPSLSLLKKAYQNYDKNIKKILNTSGKSYREKKDILLQKKEDDIFKDMVTEPMLIKRPFTVLENKEIVVGFREDFKESF